MCSKCSGLTISSRKSLISSIGMSFSVGTSGAKESIIFMNARDDMLMFKKFSNSLSGSLKFINFII